MARFLPAKFLKCVLYSQNRKYDNLMLHSNDYLQRNNLKVQAIHKFGLLRTGLNFTACYRYGQFSMHVPLSYLMCDPKGKPKGIYNFWVKLSQNKKPQFGKLY